MSIADLAKKVFEARKQVAAERERHERESARLKADVDEAARLYQIALNGLSVDMVSIAESVISVRGAYDRSGDQPRVVLDFIKWLATGECGYYSNPKAQYLGTKNYDRWNSQRCDCEYGMGPRHGSVNFAIELKREYRQDGAEMSAEQRDACIYYLENLSSIQSAKKQCEAA